MSSIAAVLGRLAKILPLADAPVSPTTEPSLANLLLAPHAHYTPHTEPAQSTTPLVLVEGFLTYTSEFFWGDFESVSP